MGYIRKHWRGQYSLAVSFWINLFLLNVVIYLFWAFLVYCELIENPLTYARVAVVCLAFVFVILYPWQIVGLWRSCNHHIEISGKRFWARAAQVIVVLGFIGNLGNLNTSWPLYKDIFQIGFGEDEYGNYTLKLEGNGTLIHLNGGLGFGVSKEIAKLLRTYPEVKGIIIDSYGGRIYEGRELSKLIYAYDLDTYSLKCCYSAATIAFVSGKQRFLGIEANLGFHQYSNYEGFDALVDIEEEQSNDLLLFQQQGIKREFLDRLFNSANDDMWYPTVDEMLDAGVIHGVIKTSELLPEKYNLGSSELEELYQVLLAIPLFKTIQQYEPETYKRIKIELDEQIEKGATLIELQRAGAEIIQPKAMSLMARTSNEALIQFAQTIIVGLRRLKEIDPILCLKTLYPEQYGSVLFSQYLFEDESVVMLDALSQIIVDAHEKYNPRVDISAAEMLMDRLIVELGENARYLELGILQNREDYEHHCDAVIKFYEKIVANDKDTAGNFLRYIFSPETGVENEVSSVEPVKLGGKAYSRDMNDFAIFAEKWLELVRDANDF